MTKSTPYVWDKNRIEKSPFKSISDAKLAEKEYKKGKSIGFTRVSSLKSMGRIPRNNGSYQLGKKYQNSQ